MGEQQRVGCINQLWLVANIGITFGGGIHFFFQHAFIGWADGVFWPAKHFGFRAASVHKGIFGHRPTGFARDFLGAIRHLVIAGAFAPFLRAIGIINCHPNHRNRRIRPANGPHTWNTSPRANNHRAINFLAQNGVWATNIPRYFGRDRSRFEAVARRFQRLRRLVNNPILGFAAILQAQIKADQLHLNARHRWR